jgi:threonyl-tRNA synthetase
VLDAHKRRHQCATFQLDFQLPERFNLKYRTSEGSSGEEFQRPVIIHRAILGSIERMIAMLSESFGGVWPFWLSPRQMMVIPVSAVFNDYAVKVQKAMEEAKLYCDLDISDATLSKKVRNAEVSQHSFIIVVGEREMKDNSVNIRKAAEGGKDVVVPLSKAVELFVVKKESRELGVFIKE